MSFAELAPYIAVGALCLLGGAALGHYTAHSDIERTRRGRPE